MEECTHLAPGNIIPEACLKKITYNVMHVKNQKYLKAHSKLTVSDFTSWDEMQKILIKCQRAHFKEEKRQNKMLRKKRDL